MKLRSIPFLILVSFLPSLAWANSDHQTWNVLSVETAYKNTAFGVELESRTSEHDSNENVHQIKPEVFHPLGPGKLGFIYTFETDGSFKEKTENRYSFAYDFKSYKSKSFEIVSRLRQEFRNFSDQNQLAYRFRIRNTLKLKSKIPLDLNPSVSSEWRVYQKDSGGETVENFSHRTVLELQKEMGQWTWTVHYTHNYQKEDAADQNVHAFGLKLGLKI